MQYGVVLAVVLATAGQAQAADQWRVTLARVTVQTMKATGQSWDADNSPPDVEGTFGVAPVTERGDCKVGQAGGIARRQDTYDFAPAMSFTVDRPASGLVCVAVQLTDADLARPDDIGKGGGRFGLGQHTIVAGQAVVQVLVEEWDAVAAAKAEALPAPRPPLDGAMLEISVISARIRPTRVDGVPWDPAVDLRAAKNRESAALLKIGAALATGGSSLAFGPVLTMFVGNTKDDPHRAKTAQAPESRVRFTVGGLVRDTPTAVDTYSPSWQGADVSFAATALQSGSVRIDVDDVDGAAAEPIGTTVIPSSDLAPGKILRLSFGQVEELILQVSQVREASEPTVGTATIAETNKFVDTGLSVVAGQAIAIEAAGKLCNLMAQCFDAAGSPYGLAFEPVDGLPKVRDGQLVALIGGTMYPVGARGTIEAKNGGKLLLFAPSATAEAAPTAASQRFVVKYGVFYPLIARF